MSKIPCVYILTNRPKGILYTGITTNLIKRVWEHQNKLADGFTKQYGINRLVWFEVHESIIEAIKKEKLLKKWRREWKKKLIEEKNPNWEDLYYTLI